jgi:lysyl-tRNA synthetase, class II
MQPTLSRQEKLDRMTALGIKPYAERYDQTHKLSQACGEPIDTHVRVAGRVTAWRDFGKLVFARLLDSSGSCQVSFEANVLSAEVFSIATELVDVGDFIGVAGSVWITKKGEPTIRCEQLAILSKAKRTLPEKWHGLTDPETRSRRRYLDLISNRETRERFVLRSRIISFIRNYLDDHDFIEVETPLLPNAATGAAARPFVTHHASLRRDLYLRVSPETYLKRLIVGGLGKVYEIGKNFRNEGIDRSHLQEFTMLEWYATNWSYRDNMRFVRELIHAILREFLGKTSIQYGGIALEFGGEWQEVSFIESVRQATSIDLLQVTSFQDLLAAIKVHYPGLNVKDCVTYPAIVDTLYKAAVRPHLIQPTFVTQQPVDLVPLARRSDDNPRLLDMFQVVINSWEVVKAYSELIDPQDQYERLAEQLEFRKKGDMETMMMEKDYIECMEYGMPPNSGLGLGIDRLIALITGVENLREVVLFPSMRDNTVDSVDSDAAGEDA